MKYTEDYPHKPILGKAGEFVDILCRSIKVRKKNHKADGKVDKGNG